MKFALAQLNPTVGDLKGNLAKIRVSYRKAVAKGADLVIFSELVTCGYSPEDMVLRPGFMEEVESAVKSFAKETNTGETKKTGALIGTPWRENGVLYNAALLLADGKIQHKVFKNRLPNFGVFDEKRIFTDALFQDPITFKGRKLGILICEDLWHPTPARHLKAGGAEIMISLNASPYSRVNFEERFKVISQRIRETKLPLIYVNQVGGQDEVVFDGRSVAMNARGRKIKQLEAWDEDFALVTGKDLSGAGKIIKDLPYEEDIYMALMTGLRDYVHKNGFAKVLLGLSGGIDSALVAVLAADVFGPENLRTVFLPSPYSAAASARDASALARKIGCRYDTLPITKAMQTLDKTLKPVFKGLKTGVTEENMQSRLRGVILMALSNKFGSLLLTTGNKSEVATGYTTLYGDMCGAFNPLKDIYKTEVYALSRWRNSHIPASSLFKKKSVIAKSILTKAPSAELRPGQRDQDTLPPYPVLDAILTELIENQKGVKEIKGYNIDLVRKVWKMLVSAEYKRYQAAPGTKVTGRAFGRDRRYPLTNGYKQE